MTFWREFAEEFERALQQELEEPVIIIISSGRITSWNGNFYFIRSPFVFALFEIIDRLF